MTADTAVLSLPAPAAPPVARRSWWRQLGVDTGAVLVGFPLALAAFILVVTGLALGAGLLVVWVGLPLLTLTLLVARGLATVERLRIPAVLDRDLPSPAYRLATAARRSAAC